MNPRVRLDDDGQEGPSPLLVIAGLVAPAALLLLAAFVLLGLSLPGSAGAVRGRRVLPSFGVARETPLPLLTAAPPTPAPFVLRTPAPLIDRSATPEPGSYAAAIAATPACVALATGRGPNGYRLGDGLLLILARDHPECP